MKLEERRVIWNRRKAERRKAFIKKVLFGTAIVVIGVFIFCLAFKKNVKAEKLSGEKLCKYYTATTIDNDETLWDLASAHSLGYRDYNEFIEEVAFINHLDDVDDIKSGQTVIIPYYTYVQEQ